MASGKRKKGFSIKFDLSLAGLFGVGVVCFCIFLWMFLLGIWSGQTVLSSGKNRLVGVKKLQIKTLQTVAKKSPPPLEQAVGAPVVKAVPAPGVKKKKVLGASKKVVVQKTKQVSESEEDPAFFAVQVAAFKDAALAVKEVRSWQDKGYSCFSRPPEGADDLFTRIYIGRFDSMDSAKKKAAALARKEKIKPFIVLVPAE
ncbi:MAG: SPOR domain-containing protein [Desulfobulbaceae bacterium]|nr:SPOR domain-containing protein [Desulfobulbaceae bacterium]